MAPNFLARKYILLKTLMCNGRWKLPQKNRCIMRDHGYLAAVSRRRKLLSDYHPSPPVG